MVYENIIKQICCVQNNSFSLWQFDKCTYQNNNHILDHA